MVCIIKVIMNTPVTKESLRKEKICFYDYSEAAKFINNIYNNNNLNLWWNSDNLQNVRKLFCEKYCRHSKNPINDLKKSFIFNE